MFLWPLYFTLIALVGDCGIDYSTFF